MKLLHCQERNRSLDLQSVEISTTATGAPSQPMKGIWGTIRSYILWQHERGTLHYDIMVTLILIFVFFSPRVINFNDKPVPHDPHLTDVVVTPDGQGGLVYQVSASGDYAGRRRVGAESTSARHSTDFRRGRDRELRSLARWQQAGAGLPGLGETKIVSWTLVGTIACDEDQGNRP